MPVDPAAPDDEREAPEGGLDHRYPDHIFDDPPEDPPEAPK